MVLTDTQKFLYFLLVDNLHHHMLEPDYRIYEYDDVDRHHSYVNNETKGSMFPILHLLDKGHGYKHVPSDLALDMICHHLTVLDYHMFVYDFASRLFRRLMNNQTKETMVTNYQILDMVEDLHTSHLQQLHQHMTYHHCLGVDYHNVFVSEINLHHMLLYKQTKVSNYPIHHQ